MLFNYVNRKCKRQTGVQSSICTLTILMFVLIGSSACTYAGDVTPDQLEFRRQAVRRMIFDRSQDIRLAGLLPAKVVGLDVMHPAVGLQENDPRVSTENGKLRISAEKDATATRWVGAKPLSNTASSRLAQIIALGCVVVQALPLDALDLGFRSLASAPVDNIDNVWQ